jgi:hypothetical protein
MPLFKSPHVECLQIVLTGVSIFPETPLVQPLPERPGYKNIPSPFYQAIKRIYRALKTEILTHSPFRHKATE